MRMFGQFAVHSGGERQAVEQAVQREPEQGRRPGDLLFTRLRSRRRMRMFVIVRVRRRVGVAVIVLMMTVGTFMVRALRLARLGVFRGAMMMKVKHPLDEEHRQEAGERVAHRRVDRAEQEERVRHQVQQPDAKHRPGDEAERGLQSRVRQADPMRNETADNRGGRDRGTVNQQQRGGGHKRIPPSRGSELDSMRRASIVATLRNDKDQN